MRDRPDNEGVGVPLEADFLSPEEIACGVEAYLSLATHDELSFSTPEEVVRAIGLAVFSLRLAKQSAHLDQPNRAAHAQ